MPCFVGIRLVIPIFEVALVELTHSEKVDDIHEQLLIGVLDIRDDCNFLAIFAPLE